MGCSSSTPTTKNRKLPGPPTNNRSTNGRNSLGGMTKNEIDQRIEFGETVQAKCGGVSIRYAYLSQRGYYPDEMHKPNQDSFTIKPSFASRPTDIFFGVFDGHGRDGDKCAQFARDNLPTLLSKSVSRKRAPSSSSASALTSSIEHKEINEAIINAHLETNRRMHASQSLDASLSGTTAISVYLHGDRNRITVGNVGDSRAIIGRRVDRDLGGSGGEATNSTGDKAANSTGEKATNSSAANSTALKAFALSRDQTPYRRDERLRCRRAGARILSLDQIEGLEPVNEELDGSLNSTASNSPEMNLGEEIDEGGDPPRIWSRNGDYPGTAFTRSLGDGIAEELGVVAEPELLGREVMGEDRIVVLASDGVFEFLTNQSVIDICAKFNDPLEACRAVVAESYELWLQYELRTDDITMICIFIDDVKSPLASSVSSSADLKTSLRSVSSVDSTQLDDDLVDSDCRPVRKNISLEKSRALEKMKLKYSHSCKDVSSDEYEDIDIHKLYNEKTEEEKARISEAIGASVIFQNISNSEREMIYGVMEPMEVKKGQWIIKQGTMGDRFYIIDEGSFAVRIVPEGKEDTNGDGGDVVHVYTGARGRSHPSFGELALVHSAPRAASIIAQTDGYLWALHRAAFKKVVDGKEGKRDAEKVLRKIERFKSFSEEDLRDLTSYLCEAKYVSGDTIVKEGEVGDSIFIILPGGECEQTTTHDGSTKTTTLVGNDFFGTEILQKGSAKQYSSTVTATSKVTCWILQKADIKRVLGSLQKSGATVA